MKIWIKYAVAAVLGAILGLFIPQGDPALLDTITRLAMNLGRYALLPLVFCSATIAAFELHEEHRLFRTAVRASAYSLAAVFVMTLVGIAGAFALSPGRLPLAADVVYDGPGLPSVLSVLGSVFPADALSTLLSFDYLFPPALFAVIVGLALAFDKAVTKPVLGLLDSLSRMLWQVNSFFVEVLPLPLIVAAAARASALAATPRLDVYGKLLFTIGAEAVFVVGAVLPAAMYLADRKRNPYKTLYALAAPALAAAVSGHAYAPAGVTAKHLAESLGVRRRAGAMTLPLALTAGRAGSAMVTATSFIVILNSYSSLGLGSSTVFWLLGIVPMTTLLMGAAPGSGPIAALALLSAAYGRGFESGYLLVVPAALPLALVACVVDTVTSAVVVAMCAAAEGHVVSKDVRHFI